MNSNYTSSRNILTGPISKTKCVNNCMNKNNISMVSELEGSELRKNYQKKIFERISIFMKASDIKFIGNKNCTILFEKGYKEMVEKINKLGDIIQNSTNSFIVFNEKVISYCFFYRRKRFISLNFEINSESLEEIEKFEKKINNVFPPEQDSIICSMQIFYKLSNGTVTNYIIDEELNDIIVPESYPYINNGNIDMFINNYFESNENVMILLGPVGTGKTKFIRKILINFITNNGGDMNAGTYESILSKDFVTFYTSSSSVLESDEIFTNFLEHENCLMILEDIDFHLRDRKDNNPLMYKLLSSSDGLIPSSNKIIISTNVDSKNKIDEALIRPGRCFDVLEFRTLDVQESNKVLEKLGSKNKLTENREYYLSEIYRFFNTGKLVHSPINDNTNRKTGFI